MLLSVVPDPEFPHTPWNLLWRMTRVSFIMCLRWLSQAPKNGRWLPESLLARGLELPVLTPDLEVKRGYSLSSVPIERCFNQSCINDVIIRAEVVEFQRTTWLVNMWKFVGKWCCRKNPGSSASSLLPSLCLAIPELLLFISQFFFFFVIKHVSGIFLSHTRKLTLNEFCGNL